MSAQRSLRTTGPQHASYVSPEPQGHSRSSTSRPGELDDDVQVAGVPGVLGEHVETDPLQGRRVVLATASYRLYADAIAQRLGFDDVIGTGSIIGLDERVHAKIAGENCYGPAKLRMIADWVETSGLKGVHGHVRFYSDHVSDRPTFEWSDEPVAVNPHGKLRRLADQRGWPIEDWG